MTTLQPLPREFFEQPAEQLAPRLLGCLLVHDDVLIRITEVEAYLGDVDPGSHARRGLTKRNATMFGPAGRIGLRPEATEPQHLWLRFRIPGDPTVSGRR